MFSGQKSFTSFGRRLSLRTLGASGNIVQNVVQLPASSCASMPGTVIFSGSGQPFTPVTATMQCLAQDFQLRAFRQLMRQDFKRQLVLRIGQRSPCAANAEVFTIPRRLHVLPCFIVPSELHRSLQAHSTCPDPVASLRISGGDYRILRRFLGRPVLHLFGDALFSRLQGFHSSPMKYQSKPRVAVRRSQVLVLNRQLLCANPQAKVRHPDHKLDEH